MWSNGVLIKFSNYIVFLCWMTVFTLEHTCFAFLSVHDLFCVILKEIKTIYILRCLYSLFLVTLKLSYNSILHALIVAYSVYASYVVYSYVRWNIYQMKDRKLRCRDRGSYWGAHWNTQDYWSSACARGGSVVEKIRSPFGVLHHSLRTVAPYEW
jgi:hypothetical protein